MQSNAEACLDPGIQLDTWTQKHVLRPMIESASARRWNRRPIIHETLLLHALQEPELASNMQEVLQLLLMSVILQAPQYD